MEIKVKPISRFKAVSITEGQVIIDLGMLNEADVEEFAGVLVDAVLELGPQQISELADWVTAMLEKRGIKLPNSAS
mgnify:CR=1 FL=1